MYVIERDLKMGGADDRHLNGGERRTETKKGGERKEDGTASVTFSINGNPCTIEGGDLASHRLTLAAFLRERMRGLTGTKISCNEGGCGACAVLLKRKGMKTRSINACLRPMGLIRDGDEIITVEGVGGSGEPYSDVQKCIANGNGSQCGFCTPGMVMAMHGLLAEKKEGEDISEMEIEKRFDGNLCRCTGYRPILQSFRKKFATKSNKTCVEDESDGATKCGDERDERKMFEPRGSLTTSASLPWSHPNTLDDLVSIVSDAWTKSQDVHIAGAFTGVNGVYRSLDIDMNLDDALVVVLDDVAELRKIDVIDESHMSFGASVSIQQMIDAMNDNKIVDSYGDLDALAYAMSRVASHHVRNVGTWAGNVAMARDVHFPSDLVTALIACDASVSVLLPSNDTPTTMTLWNMLQLSEDDKRMLLITLSVPLASSSATTSIETRFCKAAARAQNSHSLLNGGFRCTIDNHVSGKPIVVEDDDVVLVFGGTGPQKGPVRASKTEAYLKGKALDASTLKGALSVLQDELKIEPEFVTAECPKGKKLEYRESLPIAFFYKFYVALLTSFAPGLVPETIKSAGERMYTERALSRATQSFSTDPKMAPVNQDGIVKLSALKQASGEAVYSDDIPTADVLYGALATSTVACGTLSSLDTKSATEIDGVVAVFDATSIPGTNDVAPFTCGPLPNTIKIPLSRPVFVPVKGDVVYYGQPIALVVATSREIAEAGARAVSATYDQTKTTAVITIDDAIKSKSFYSTDFSTHIVESGDVESALEDSSIEVVKGTVRGGGMRHFYMEKQTSVAIPDEKRIVVHTATQNLDSVRRGVASVLGLSGGDVTVKMRRAGGSFGGKITGATLPSAAVSVAARALKRPVCLQNSIYTDHQMIGGRHRLLADFTVGFKADGTITALDITGYLDGGAILDATMDTVQEFALSVDACYAIPNFRCTSYPVRTNTQPNTSIRGPGQVPGSLVAETVIETVATALKMDPQAVRERNFYTSRNCITPFGQPMIDSFSLPDVWKRLIETGEIDSRKAAIAKFNSENRWRKRGLAVAPVKYSTFNWPSSNGILSINTDGTVVIQHGMCEIGQGIHTRVAQVCAYSLGCPLSCVRIADTSTNIMPNLPVTGGSVSTGSASQAVRLACLEMKRRFAPVVEKLGSDVVNKAKTDVASWSQICEAAQSNGVNMLCVSQFKGPPGSVSDWASWGEGLDGAYRNYPCAYFNFGAGCSEVEIDVLTGEHWVVRTDIVYDCGKSLNPQLDLGQVEGAFTMGLGWYTREEMMYRSDGSMITNGTWEYKPPCSMDVPLEFNVELLKNSTFAKGVLRSKAVGEPPKILSYTIFEALKMAIAASRKERGLSSAFDLNVPASVDAIKTALAISVSDLSV